jgi:hypothetical protein
VCGDIEKEKTIGAIEQSSMTPKLSGRNLLNGWEEPIRHGALQSVNRRVKRPWRRGTFHHPLRRQRSNSTNAGRRKMHTSDYMANADDTAFVDYVQ